MKQRIRKRRADARVEQDELSQRATELKRMLTALLQKLNADR